MPPSRPPKNRPSALARAAAAALAAAAVLAVAPASAAPAAPAPAAGGEARGARAVAGGLLAAAGLTWLATRRYRTTPPGPGGRRGAGTETGTEHAASERPLLAPRPPSRTARQLSTDAATTAPGGRSAPTAGAGATGWQVLDTRCCLAAGDSAGDLLDGAAAMRVLARPDPALHDDDGYPLLTARLAAIDAEEGGLDVDATVPTRRALAALLRTLPNALAATAGRTPPASVVVGLPPRTPQRDRLMAADWGRRRFGSPVDVVAADASTLWRMAFDRCAASPGRAVVLAAAASELDPGGVPPATAAGRPAARPVDRPVPGEGAVVLTLRSAMPPDEPAADVTTLHGVVDDHAPAAPETDPAAHPQPAGALAEAVSRALAAAAMSHDELGGWVTDLQPQASEAGACLGAMADLGLAAEPGSLTIGRCGSLGAVGSLAAVALAAEQARRVGRATLALCPGPPRLAFVVRPPVHAAAAVSGDAMDAGPFVPRAVRRGRPFPPATQECR